MSHREQDRYQGPLHTVFAKTVQFGGLPHESKPVPLSAYSCVYDRAGNRTELAGIYYQPDGSTFSNKTTWAYDEAGRPVEELFYSEEHLSAKTVYNSGQPRETLHFQPDGSLASKTDYTLDQRGRVVKTVSRNLAGVVLAKTETVYSAKGARVEKEVFPAEIRHSAYGKDVTNARGNSTTVMADGPHSAKSVYDAQGNPLEITFYGDFHSVISKYRLVHDESGYLTSVLHFGVGTICIDGFCSVKPNLFLKLILPRLLKASRNLQKTLACARRGELNQAIQTLLRGTPITETFYQYDAAGRRIEEKILFEGELCSLTSYAYDSYGKTIKRAIYTGEGALEMSDEFEREYDRYGNWVKKTGRHWIMACGQAESGISVCGQAGERKSTTVVERTISYY